MTYEEVRELLKSVRSKKSRLLAMQEYIAEARQLMLGVTTPQFGSVVVMHSQENGTEKRMMKYLERYSNLKDRYDKLFEEMCAEEDQLCAMMQNLSPEEHEVILNRYLRGLSVRKTAKIMNYSEDWVYVTQRSAIKKMYEF